MRLRDLCHELRLPRVLPVHPDGLLAELPLVEPPVGVDDDVVELFESEPEEERLFLGSRNNVRHDVADLKLDADSVQRHDEVRVVEGPVTPKSLSFSGNRVQRVAGV